MSIGKLNKVLCSLIIAILVLSIQPIQNATANFIPIAVHLESPDSANYTTYTTNQIPLIFRVYVYAYYQHEWNLDTKIVTMFYSLDGKANVTASTIQHSKDEQGNDLVKAEAVLSELSEGPHRVIGYAEDQNGKVYSYWSDFIIDTSISEPSPSPTPTPTPTIEPSPTLSPTITPTPTITPSPTLEPSDVEFPILIVASIIIIATGIIAILVYNKSKRRS